MEFMFNYRKGISADGAVDAMTMEEEVAPYEVLREDGGYWNSEKKSRDCENRVSHLQRTNERKRDYGGSRVDVGLFVA
jgi:hypothetical protein